jgi:hypothetical protein
LTRAQKFLGRSPILGSGRAGRRLAINLAWDITRSSRCDLVILVIPPAIAWEVSRVLKITSQTGATIPLRHSEFYEYRVHMEWFQGKLFFMWG